MLNEKENDGYFQESVWRIYERFHCDDSQRFSKRMTNGIDYSQITPFPREDARLSLSWEWAAEHRSVGSVRVTCSVNGAPADWEEWWTPPIVPSARAELDIIHSELHHWRVVRDYNVRSKARGRCFYFTLSWERQFLWSVGYKRLDKCPYTIKLNLLSMSRIKWKLN